METLLISLLAAISIASLGSHIALVAMFLGRQRELEELALIDAKERREYLTQASSRMAVQTENIRKQEHGLIGTPPEYEPLNRANRRMREAEA